MTELSPDARHVLAKLLDRARFEPVMAGADRGPVIDEQGIVIVRDVPRRAWVELIAATGKPDDAYAEDGSRVGRVIEYVGGIPVIDVDG